MTINEKDLKLPKLQQLMTEVEELDNDISYAIRRLFTSDTLITWDQGKRTGYVVRSSPLNRTLIVSNVATGKDVSIAIRRVTAIKDPNQETGETTWTENN